MSKKKGHSIGANSDSRLSEFISSHTQSRKLTFPVLFPNFNTINFTHHLSLRPLHVTFAAGPRTHTIPSDCETPYNMTTTKKNSYNIVLAPTSGAFLPNMLTNQSVTYEEMDAESQDSLTELKYMHGVYVIVAFYCTPVQPHITLILC